MTPSFFLRPIRREAADLAAVLEVYRQCEDFLSLGPQATATPEMVLADLALSEELGGVFYGIFDAQGGMMIGVFDYVRAGYRGDPAAAYLSLLMIGAPFRRKGLGAEVVAAVETDIRGDARVQVIDAGVQVNNPGGIAFWTAMGYRIISGPTRQADGTTTFDLRKDL